MDSKRVIKRAIKVTFNLENILKDLGEFIECAKETSAVLLVPDDAETYKKLSTDPRIYNWDFMKYPLPEDAEVIKCSEEVREEEKLGDMKSLLSTKYKENHRQDIIDLLCFLYDFKRKSPSMRFTMNVVEKIILPDCKPRNLSRDDEVWINTLLEGFGVIHDGRSNLDFLLENIKLRWDSLGRPSDFRDFIKKLYDLNY